MKKQILKEFEEKFNPKDDWGSLNLMKEKILECNNEVKDWLSKKIDEIQELETIYWQNETKIALQEEHRRIINKIKEMKKGKIDGESKLWEAHYMGYDEALQDIIKVVNK
jgi:hypothetical protein